MQGLSKVQSFLGRMWLFVTENPTPILVSKMAMHSSFLVPAV
jgi:hypothetical protein